MKRLLAYVFVIFIFGCSQQADQKTDTSIQQSPANTIASPRLKIRITSEQTTFNSGEPITIMILLKKIIDEVISAPDTYWSIVVWVDDKPFEWHEPKTSPDKVYVRKWSGPGYIDTENEIGLGLTLSDWGISQDILPSGKHDIVVSVGQDYSNKLTITIK